MSKINNQLIVDSEKFIAEILTEKLDKNYFYHNINHALNVKKYAEIIGENCKFSDEEMDILRISALFHDVGYIYAYDDHVEEGLKIASEFLNQKNLDQHLIDHVLEIILATKMPQNPKDKIAEALCDADLMYIASENCYEQFELMYEETKMRKEEFSNRTIFELDSIRFFTDHSYFTNYGRTVLQPKKELASSRILDRMKRRELKRNQKGTINKKNVSYSRGVETLFRLTARNQINLNSIADNKSNILISVNAIIISIIITMLAGNLGSVTNNIIPVITFLVICLITIVLAILSTRPNVKWGNFTEEDVKQNKVDLTFFGDFINMNYEDYLKAVNVMIKNDERLYSTMIRNQYSLGKILAKKFRLIKIAYNVFMIGIIITVLAFLITFLVGR